MNFNKTFLAMVLACFTLDGRAVVTDMATHRPESAIYEFETLNFNLIASRQAFVQVPISQSTTASKAIIRQSKLTTWDIMAVLAAAYGTNWPVGAKLALDRRTDAMYVFDRTGKNPVCNLTTGIDDGTNLVCFNCDSHITVYADQPINPRFTCRQKLYGKMSFRLFVARNDLVYTDLRFDGATIGDQRMTAENQIIQDDSANITGDGLFSDGTLMMVTGQVTGTGRWPYTPDAGPVL